MNLNPFAMLSKRGGGRQTGDSISAAQKRAGQPLGPWTSVMSDYVAREVAPQLYEAIREAVPVVDAAINRMVTIDGILRVEGNSGSLVNEIEDWKATVPVGDVDSGLQAWYAMCGNEMYEQGFFLGETVLAPDGRDIAKLNVGDSKGGYFRRVPGAGLETWYMPPAPTRFTRRDGTEQVERVLRNSWRSTESEIMTLLEGAGYRQLDPAMMIYGSNNPEANNPYGVSLMRSMEFVTRVLLTMDASLQRVWERFGDPIFHVKYKSANLRPDRNDGDKEKLEARRSNLATALASALTLKRNGQSADIVNAMGKDDEISIEVLGEDGQVMAIKEPAQHVLEQIVAKTGLPPWILGYVWGTAERLAMKQSELLLQESRTRYAHRKPGLTRVVATMLRARGRTWKRGDWDLVQELPNLQDMLAQAQAEFLQAQTQMMLANGTTNPSGSTGSGASGARMAKVTADGNILLPTEPGYDREQSRMVDLLVPDFAHQVVAARRALEAEKTHFDRPHSHDDKGHKAETYVEDGTNLMRLERAANNDLQDGWGALYDGTLKVLGISGKAAKAVTTFLFDREKMLAALLANMDTFVASVAAPDAALAKSMYEAWARGVANGATELGADQMTADVQARVSREMAPRGLDLVRNAAVQAYRNDIVLQLEQGAYDGQNPKDVARALRARFDAHTYDWERLARSEIAAAQGRGKVDQYTAHGIQQYDWIEAGGACPICTGLAKAGPYPVGGGPLPMTDSHPNCRCTIEAVVS